MAKKKIYKRKRFAFPLTIILILIAFRIALPYIVKNYVNGVLNNIPGYYGQVDDIDISLIRGAYIINGLYLNKTNAASQVPFLKFPKTDISIEWNALFKGKIVSEIYMSSPEFLYVFEDQQKETKNEPEYDDWTKALTNIVPIEINHLNIKNGKAAFLQLDADPNIDLQFYQIDLVADNLRNVVQKERTLPSNVSATARSIGDGKVTLNGRMNLVKNIPDMDLGFTLENASATALNDFTKHYAGIDFSSGEFNLYSEIAIADGYLTGYMKPLLKDAKLIGKGDGFLSILWEGFVGLFKFLLKNKGNNTLATEIPIEGDLNNVKGKVWPTIFNTIKNGWVKAFKDQLDDDVDFSDAIKKADEK